MPRPAVIRFSCPGLIICSLPRLSRCSTLPESSHVTVCSPMCGCGGTRMPATPSTDMGP